MSTIPLFLFVDAYITSMTDLSKVSIVDTLRKTDGQSSFDGLSKRMDFTKPTFRVLMRVITRLLMLITALILAALTVGRGLLRGRELGLIYVHPAWSGICLFDIDRGMYARLLNVDAQSFTWSSDGQQILIAQSQPSASDHYLLFDIKSGQKRYFSVEGLYSASLAWSPDGARIALARYGKSVYDIYIVRLDGTDWQQITDSGASDLMPAWSPDGKQLAYVSSWDSNYQLYITDMDGSNPRRLTRNMGNISYPAWSPDGTHIAFSTQRLRQSNIYIWDTADGTFRALTVNKYDFFAPRWSPDGQMIVFEGTASTMGSDIYLIEMGGGMPRLLIAGSELFRSPMWRP